MGLVILKERSTNDFLGLSVVDEWILSEDEDLEGICGDAGGEQHELRQKWLLILPKDPDSVQ